MFLSLHFFFLLHSHLQTLFCLVNPLPGFSVTVTVRQKRLHRGHQRAGPHFIASLPQHPRAKTNDVLFMLSYMARTETTFSFGIYGCKVSLKSIRFFLWHFHSGRSVTLNCIKSHHPETTFGCWCSTSSSPNIRLTPQIWLSCRSSQFFSPKKKKTHELVLPITVSWITG